MMFRDMMRWMSGVCCAAVVVCGVDVRGMRPPKCEQHEYMRQVGFYYYYGKAGTQTFHSAYDFLDYVDSLKTDSTGKYFAEAYNRRLYPEGGTDWTLSWEELTVENLNLALADLAFYKKELLPNGRCWNCGSSHAKPFLYLFRHWKTVIQGLTEGTINKQDLTIVMSCLPEVVQYVGFCSDYWSACGGRIVSISLLKLIEWERNMESNIDFLAVEENQLIVEDISKFLEEVHLRQPQGDDGF